MAEIKNGGLAFPGNFMAIDGSYDTGMSLRDWFAGQALAATLPEAIHFNCPEASPMPSAARMAYELADAMLAAREERT